MNKGFLISLVFNVLLFGTIFYVKSHYMGAAYEFGDKVKKQRNEAVKRLKNQKTASSLLWQLALNTGKPGTDKKEIIKVLKNFVKKHKDSLKFSESRDEQNKKNWLLGWQGIDEAYTLVFEFDKGKLLKVDYSGMIPQK